MRPADVESCKKDVDAVRVATKTLHIEYPFDGKQYQATAATAAAARVFANSQRVRASRRAE